VCLTALLVDMLLLLLQLLSTLFDSSIFLRSFRVGLGSQRCPEEEVWGFWCEIFYLCAGCPSCHPTSSVKARQQYAVSSISSLSFIDVFSLSVSFLFDYRVFFTWSASWLVLVHFWSPQEKNIRDCWRENFTGWWSFLSLGQYCLITEVIQVAYVQFVPTLDYSEHFVIQPVYIYGYELSPIPNGLLEKSLEIAGWFCYRLDALPVV